MPILLNANATTGVSTYYHDDPDNPGGFVIEKRLDVAPIKDFAAEMRAQTSGQQFGSMRKVGVIPAHMLGELLRDGRINDEKYLSQFFAENPHLKTFDKTF